MAWLKRNLFFVLGMAAGMILTGYCAYVFFFVDLSKNVDLDKDYADNASQYDALRTNTRVPYPSEENIQHAREDQTQVKAVVDELHKTFVPFPAPPPLDAKGFSEYLENTIFDLRTKATNAEVGVPDDFAYGFTDLRGKLNPPLENIPLWMQQLAEIKTLCDILYHAKINSLISLRRVPVSTSNDSIVTVNDLLSARIAPTPFGTATPYKMEFKCFSRELAAVLDGLARSSNFISVKNIVVKPAGPRTIDQPGSVAAVLAGDQPVPPGDAPVRRPRETPAQYEAEMRQYNMKAMNYQRAMEAWAAKVASGRAGLGLPVTVEREQLLYITLSVEVVKFK
jgi:hypothetical protein